MGGHRPPAGFGLAVTNLWLRLVSSRAPYQRAGLSFAPGPERSYGLVLVEIVTLGMAAIAQLLADPHVDVSAGRIGMGFYPVGDEGDLEMVAGGFEALDELMSDDGGGASGAVGTMEALRLAHEREAAAASGPMGDEERAEVASFLAAARSPRGATIKVGGKPKAPAKPRRKPE